MIQIVKISDLKVSDKPDIIITYSLGSCLGLAIYDPVAKVGGMLHAMLAKPSDIGKNPFQYVNSGVPLLFQKCYTLGAKKERLKIVAAGCASLMNAASIFEIGKRNIAMLEALFVKNGVRLNASILGGHDSRTLKLDLATGKTSVQVRGKEIVL